MECAGCGCEFGQEMMESHFGRYWCPPCELQLQDPNDEYYNSSDEWNDLMDAEADAYHSQWDDDPNPYDGTYDDMEGCW